MYLWTVSLLSILILIISSNKFPLLTEAIWIYHCVTTSGVNHLHTSSHKEVKQNILYHFPLENNFKNCSLIIIKTINTISYWCEYCHIICWKKSYWHKDGAENHILTFEVDLTIKELLHFLFSRYDSSMQPFCLQLTKLWDCEWHKELLPF